MPTLKELRLNKGLTLQVVSQETGISISALSKYENGMTAVSADIKNILERYFGEEFTTIPPLTYKNYKEALETLEAAKQLIKVQSNRLNYYENFIKTLHEDLGIIITDARPISDREKYTNASKKQKDEVSTDSNDSEV